jgi:HAD superfamily hydrolase (TIGR01549 family)
LDALMAETIRGILFDLGDTILDFGSVDVLGKFEAGAHLAYDFLAELGMRLPSFAAFYRRQLWAFRWNYFKSHFTGREFNTLDILGQLGLRMGHDLSAEQMLELAWKWYEPLSRQASVEEGARPLLQGFAAAGLKLGVISNTFVPGVILDRHLAAENLLDLLPVRIYSCDVVWRKPNPNIFQLALERAGLTAPQTLFVGDSLQADIDGANKVGMISVLKDPPRRHRHSSIRPRYHITRLGDLREIIRQHNAGF